MSKFVNFGGIKANAFDITGSPLTVQSVRVIKEFGSTIFNREKRENEPEFIYLVATLSMPELERPLTQHWQLAWANEKMPDGTLQWAFKPNADGTQLEVNEDATYQEIRGFDNPAIALLDSFVDAGFPRNRISEDLSQLDGAKVVLKKGTYRGRDRDKKVTDIPVNLVDKILEVPASAAETQKVAAKKEAAPADDGLRAKAHDAVLEALKANKGERSLKLLVRDVFNQLHSDKSIKLKDVVSLVQAPDFIGAYADDWVYDSDSDMVVSL